MSLQKQNDEEHGASLGVVLIISIFLVFTVAGLLFTLSSVDKAKPKLLVNGGKAVGKVSIALLPEGETPAEVPARTPPVSTASGKVVLRLLPRK